MEARIWFTATLGPLLIILTLFLSLLRSSADAYFLPLIALVGTPIACLWPKRGLWIAQSLLLLTVIAGYPLLPYGERLWYLGLALSISIGFLIGHIASQEVSTWLKRLKSLGHTRALDLFGLHKKLETLKEHVDTLTTRCEALQSKAKPLEDLESKVRTLQSCLLDERLRTKKLTQTLKTKRDQLNQSRCDAFQQKLTQTTVGQIRHLRDQFLAKDAILNQTRQQLWQLESSLLALQNERQEEALTPDPAYDQLITENETSELEELVTSLLHELKGRSVPTGFGR